jgi:hypothetical protein
MEAPNPTLSSTLGLLNLPQDIILVILSEFCVRNDVTKVAGTCKDLKKICYHEQLWKDVDIYNIKSFVSTADDPRKSHIARANIFGLFTNL